MVTSPLMTTPAGLQAAANAEERCSSHAKAGDGDALACGCAASWQFYMLWICRTGRFAASKQCHFNWHYMLKFNPCPSHRHSPLWKRTPPLTVSELAATKLGSFPVVCHDQEAQVMQSQSSCSVESINVVLLVVHTTASSRQYVNTYHQQAAVLPRNAMPI